MKFGWVGSKDKFENVSKTFLLFVLSSPRRITNVNVPFVLLTLVTSQRTFSIVPFAKAPDVSEPLLFAMSPH